MKVLRLSSVLLAVLACLLLVVLPAPVAGAPDAKAAPCAAAGKKKLGENFSDYTVPKRAKATVGESLGFAAIVVGVLCVASVNTYFKVKTNPKLPGYTQAVYMRDRDAI